MFRAKPSDVFDQLHACYSPYASVIALDRGTAARVREMKAGFSDRVVDSLRDWNRLVEASREV